MTRMKPGEVLEMARLHFPSFLRSREQAISLDLWIRGEQYDERLDDIDSRFNGRPFSPPRADTNEEFDNLGGLTPTPWAGLVVTSLAQTAYVDGMRMPRSNENMKAWKTWQRNRWDSKQTGVTRTAIGLGTAYGVVLPGTDPLSGDKMAKMLARSPKRMAAFYDNDDDEWPIFAVDALPYDNFLGIQEGWTVSVYDEFVTHRISCKGNGPTAEDWTYIDYESHGMPVPPVARLCNRIDLDGRATGEIEPIMPMLRRIDQDMFDRLIVQRFGAWKVRYIAGMAKPNGNAAAEALRLSITDLLVSGDHETKFGTLDATDIKGFIDGSDHDLRMLAAITQTPPHHLLGLSSNLQAEALAAAESGLQRKSADFKMNAGEFYEQMARLTAMVNGDTEEAKAFDLQVRWRDTESRSLTQAADALGKLAVQLKIPVEMLWEKVPGWTDGDTERAKALVESGDFEKLMQSLLEAEVDPLAKDAQQAKAKSDALAAKNPAPVAAPVVKPSGNPGQ